MQLLLFLRQLSRKFMKYFYCIKFLYRSSMPPGLSS
jgi:hypothetical protein